MLLSDIKEGAQARKRKKSKDKAAPDPAKKTKKAATPEHDRRTRTGTRDRGARESRKPEHPRDLYRNIRAGTSAHLVFDSGSRQLHSRYQRKTQTSMSGV